MELKITTRGQGYPILCLHGHPGSKECHDVFTASLAPHWRTIAPDLRGYGASQTSQSFSMEAHLTDLIELLDHQEIADCIILGWSLGGILALELALRYPDRVKGLILVASAAHPVSQHPPITRRDSVFTVVASILNRIKPGWRWNIQVFGQRSLYRYLVQTHQPRTYRHLARYAWPAFFKTSKAAHQALNQALKNGYNQTEQLHRIEIPALVLAGECDRHITAASSELTARQLPNSTYRCYPRTAHLFPWEIPDQVNQDIKAWLTQWFKPSTQS